MDEWVKMENLDLTTVDISDSEGSDGKGCGCLLKLGVCYYRLFLIRAAVGIIALHPAEKPASSAAVEQGMVCGCSTGVKIQLCVVRPIPVLWGGEQSVIT